MSDVVLLVVQHRAVFVSDEDHTPVLVDGDVHLLLRVGLTDRPGEEVRLSQTGVSVRRRASLLPPLARRARRTRCTSRTARTICVHPASDPTAVLASAPDRVPLCVGHQATLFPASTREAGAKYEIRALLHPTDAGEMRATEYEWVSHPLSFVNAMN